MERLSKCCSANLDDFDYCQACKEPSEPAEDENELREMQDEESRRLESEKKYP